MFTGRYTKPVSCEHEQKAQCHSLSIGVAMVANKRALFVMLMGRVHQFEELIVSVFGLFSSYLINSLCLYTSHSVIKILIFCTTMTQSVSYSTP